jgi:uncharacterized protein DUF397
VTITPESPLRWRKSTWSGGEEATACVEIAALADGVAVRDSKDPEGPRLALARADFRALLSDITAG